MRRRRALAVTFAVLAGLAAPRRARADDVEAPAPAPSVVVGVVPAVDPEVARDLEAGLALACVDVAAEGGVALVVRRGGGAGPWGSTGPAAVALVHDAAAVAIVTPPERGPAHEIVQVASKLGVPVLATAAAASVLGTGSPWVVRVVARAPDAPAAGDASRGDAQSAAPPRAAFDAAFRARFARTPSPAAVAGYDAGRALAAALAGDAGRAGIALRDALRGVRRVEGAAAPFAFDLHGERRALAPPTPVAADAAGAAMVGALRETVRRIARAAGRLAAALLP